MRMKHITVLYTLSLFMCLSACDQGDIYPEVVRGTRNVNVQTTVTGTEGWPEDTYSLVLAVFQPGAELPADTVSLPRVKEGKQSNITLNGIPDNASTAALCIVKRRTKEVVYTFASEVLSTEHDLTILNTKSIDLLPYERIQKQLFTQCVQCHGASQGTEAAGLNLMEGVSYGQLVSHPATYSTKMRVQPSRTDASFLLDVLDGTGTSHLGRPFDHSVSISSLTEDDLILLKAWIRVTP